jgi:hypothetical protein
MRICLLLTVVLLCSNLLQAQSEKPLGLRVNGVAAEFSTYAEGRATAEGFIRVCGTGDKTIENILINYSSGIYVGYLMTIEKLADSTKLRITIKPLPEEAIRSLPDSVHVKKLGLKFPNRAVLGPAPLPRYPDPQVINLNDVIKLPLWINRETGAIIGDQIRFTLDKPRPAQDFTLNDVWLNLTGFRLFINNEVRSGDREFRGLIGRLPYFYVPGKGRFILSIKPHEGYDFQKIGQIDGNRISFSYGGDEFELVSREPVLNRGKWHLWVLHDDSFSPSPEELKDLNLYSNGNCCLYGILADASLLPTSKSLK